MNSGNSAMNPYALVYSTASNAGIHRGMSLPFCMSQHVESANLKSAIFCYMAFIQELGRQSSAKNK